MHRVKRIVGMPPAMIAYKAIRKGVRLLDRPISWLELKHAGITTHHRTTYGERVILRELKTCLPE